MDHRNKKKHAQKILKNHMSPIKLLQNKIKPQPALISYQPVQPKVFYSKRLLVQRKSCTV